MYMLEVIEKFLHNLKSAKRSRNADTCSHMYCQLNLLSTRDENTEFANSIDLDEVAHNEPPHLDLHCLPSSL